LSGCSHLSKSTVPDFKLDDAIFEPAIIQSEITEATDEPQKPETVIVERFTSERVIFRVAKIRVSPMRSLMPPMQVRRSDLILMLM